MKHKNKKQSDKVKKVNNQAPKKVEKMRKSVKKKYKVINWREYNAALVSRGDIHLWINQDAIAEWLSKERSGKRGKPLKYSETAIRTALTLGQVFRLTLRQTEGFLASIIKSMGLALPNPDYSTLSFRSRTLLVDTSLPVGDKPLHIVVDSTGVKVYGEGEWKVRQHGYSKRRTWLKLHLGVDESTNEVKAVILTDNSSSDGEVLPELLNQIPDKIEQVSGDGGYDKKNCYQYLQERAIKTVIPPRKDAKIWQHGNRKDPPHPRDENLRKIRHVGRKKWKEDTNYHRRSLAETAMFRLKTIFAETVSARTFANQKTELFLRCQALNVMTSLGMPKTVVVA